MPSSARQYAQKLCIFQISLPRTFDMNLDPPLFFDFVLIIKK
eukprot:UN22757